MGRIGPAALREVGWTAFGLLLWCVLATWLAAASREIRLSDIFDFIARAHALDFRSRDGWVHPFYPCGYPAALRVVAEVVGDYRRAGQILSVLAGALSLGAVWITARVGFGWAVAGAATLLLALHAGFNETAIAGGTDMPAIALSSAALAALALYLRRPRRRWPVAAGALLGLAYLVRYSVLALLPVALLFVLLASRRERRERRGDALALGAAFLVAALPQLLPTALEHGNPFWNRQDVNVYFGIFGEQNWGRNWAAANLHANGIVGIFLDHPAAFVGNLLGNLAQTLTHLPLLPTLALAAIGLLRLARRRQDWPTAALLSATALVTALATSLAFVTARLTVPLLPVVTVIAAYGLIHFAPEWIERRRRVTLTVTLLAAVTLWTGIRDSRALGRRLAPTEISVVSEVLHRDGMTSAARVLSLDYGYHDLRSPRAERFQIPWAWPEPPTFDSAAALIDWMRRQRMRWLVFDQRAPLHVASLTGVWPPAEVPATFVELYRGPEWPHARVWRLLPTAAARRSSRSILAGPPPTSP